VANTSIACTVPARRILPRTVTSGTVLAHADVSGRRRYHKHTRRAPLTPARCRQRHAECPPITCPPTRRTTYRRTTAHTRGHEQSISRTYHRVALRRTATDARSPRTQSGMHDSARHRDHHAAPIRGTHIIATAPTLQYAHWCASDTASMRNDGRGEATCTIQRCGCIARKRAARTNQEHECVIRRFTNTSIACTVPARRILPRTATSGTVLAHADVRGRSRRWAPRRWMESERVRRGLVPFLDELIALFTTKLVCVARRKIADSHRIGRAATGTRHLAKITHSPTRHQTPRQNMSLLIQWPNLTACRPRVIPCLNE
jgi:hypothetical protein